MRKKHRKQKNATYQVVAEHAATYGVSVPGEATASQRFLSPNDIGKILSLTGEAVKQWIYQRRLPAVKLSNGYWKIKVSDLEAFLKARQEMAKRRVLIVSDSTDLMPDVTSTVHQLGNESIISSSYADALLKAIDHHPALIVINCNSTQVDYWRFAQKIRGTKALRNVSILLMGSEELSETESERAIELAAQGFLRRPIGQEALSNEIERILKR